MISVDVVEGSHKPGVAGQDRPHAVSAPPIALPPLPVRLQEMHPASVLALQRAAGNRATSELLRGHGPIPPSAPTAARRELARCAGACSCGGKCKQDELLEDEPSKQIQRAVARRVAAIEPARLARTAQRDDQKVGAVGVS